VLEAQLQMYSGSRVRSCRSDPRCKGILDKMGLSE
jgi:hypothetical protein